MLFNSLHFLVFFPIVTLIYFSIPHRFRWTLLLVSSYYFYMSWKAEYVILIIISTLIDYIAAIKIRGTDSIRKKRLFLSLSLAGNLGMLFAFKYFNFFSDSARALLEKFSIQLSPMTLKVLLPVGISFYTFQTISYTIDVYRGKIKPERHLGIFAVYVSYFPQLVAGPIERAKHLLPQFYKKHDFNYKMASDGFKLMLWGFFKKMVVADRLAVLVSTVYGNPTDYTGIPLILATIFFAFQIYCDFSGYSDIAIGSAQIMGFNLMDNFKRPYFSRSIGEFWRRWHISLSTWFKDYVYIPLGGSRVSVPRMYLNLLVVFVASGLWHGANWTFVIWGALHGMYIVFEIMARPFKNKAFHAIALDRLPRALMLIEVGWTFLIVNLGWIFFRANSLSDALYIVTHLFSGISFNFTGINIGFSWNELFISFAVIAFMEFVHFIQEHRSIRQFLSGRPLPLRWAVYLAIVLSIVFLGKSGVQFIYFQF
ncbi:MBOAT family protein [Candidatus Woesearchaeota archaeon]|nr:MBOAT family protein [Candidatus Woesearchaeota archaeon]